MKSPRERRPGRLPGAAGKRGCGGLTGWLRKGVELEDTGTTVCKGGVNGARAWEHDGAVYVEPGFEAGARGTQSRVKTSLSGQPSLPEFSSFPGPFTLYTVTRQRLRVRWIQSGVGKGRDGCDIAEGALATESKAPGRAPVPLTRTIWARRNPSLPLPHPQRERQVFHENKIK